MEKVKVAIVGPGNIGIDLMEKIRKGSRNMELVLMIGNQENSEGLRRAKAYGIDTDYTGLDKLLNNAEIKIVFEATTATAHEANAPLYKAAGKIAVDLTPAAVGPYIVPVINRDSLCQEQNVNMVTCGGQATTPIVYAVSRIQAVEYAEIVSTISSKSAGPGTRANIDEFTHTTAKALETVGGAKKGKALIILNPAEPPILMRNTIYCKTETEPDMDKIADSIKRIVSDLQKYVPGYEMIMPPTYDGNRIATAIQVTGAGDYLPEYAGNLDIITCGAFKVGEEIAESMLGGAWHE